MYILVHDLDENIQTYQDAITASGTYLLNKKYINPEYITACINREKDYPTGLLMSNGLGIAIPHANYQLVNTNAISLVRSTTGIVFRQMEDSDLLVTCHLIFNLALPTSDQHLFTLKRLFTLFQNETFLTNCQHLSCEQVETFIKQQLNS